MVEMHVVRHASQLEGTDGLTKRIINLILTTIVPPFYRNWRDFTFDTVYQAVGKSVYTDVYDYEVAIEKYYRTTTTGVPFSRSYLFVHFVKATYPGDCNQKELICNFLSDEERKCWNTSLFATLSHYN